MGIRQIMAICKDCRKNKKRLSDYSEYGEFWIAFEWMDKETLLEHIQEEKCPMCNGDNWFLTDTSQI